MRSRYNLAYLILIIFMLVTMLMVPNPVYAATQDRAIASEGSETDGTYVGGATNYTNLNDWNDATYLRIDGTPAYYYHSYNMQDFVTPAADINGVSITFRSKRNNTYVNITPYVLIGGTKYYGDIVYPDAATTYVEDTFNGVTNKNPATGNAWDVATLNSVEWGIRTWGHAFNDALHYDMKITVDYDPIVLATVTTNGATEIGYTAPNHIATINGSITNTGGENADYYGFAYGTTANATVPASTEPPNNATYGISWISALGSYGTGNYHRDLTGLVICSTYYFRFASHNSIGWSWGSQLTFTTLCNPDIITQAATYIGATTARLNSLIITDGGQPCDVRFLYSTVSGNCTDGADCTTGSCNATTYNGTTPWVENTYETGEQPYVDISGLVPLKTYYFCSQIRNDVSCRCGGELSFTTASGVVAPTNLKGIPGATTLSLFWVKGTGSTNTLIRYKLNTYPNSLVDGELGYFDTMTSVTIPSLSQGTTYYIRAWGESGGIYSSDNITLILTTLGEVAGQDIVSMPSTPANWLSAPDYTNVSGIPWFGLVNWWADSFGIQRSTLWFLGAMFLSIAIGILIYWKGGHKILIADLAVMVCIGVFAAMELTPYWLLLPFAIFAITAVTVGERI